LTSPLVSVLLPYRDEELFLGEALDSLRRQTLDDIEVLMVNDGSTDGSLSIAAAFARSDTRFRCIECSGRGLVDALNTALSEARAPWAARMDADDISLPRRLELQLQEAVRLGPRTVISCLVHCFPEEMVSDGYRVYENWVNSLIDPDEIEMGLFTESPIPHPSAFFHRESVSDAGGYTERELPEDYELWLRLWKEGFRFQKVPEVLLHWRERPDRLSRTSSAYSLSSFYRLKAKYLHWVPSVRRSGGRVLIAGAGQTAKRLSKYLMREGFEIEAFIDPDKSREGTLLRGKQVVPPEAVGDWSLPVIVAVRAPGAKMEIEGYLHSSGLVEWRDFVICS